VTPKQFVAQTGYMFGNQLFSPKGQIPTGESTPNRFFSNERYDNMPITPDAKSS
jgi:hypothetical protein